MRKEIERKFLVDKFKLPALKNGKSIIQGYFSKNPQVRIRIENQKAYLTIKSLGLISRDEFEYKIPLYEAKKILKLAQLKIEKIRCKIKIENLTWEIDFYQGKNKGLVIAEVELPKKNFKFKKPLWATKEITNDLKYRNTYLAEKPYSEWSIKDRLF